MLQLVQMMALCFSVVAAVVAVAILVRTFRLLALAREQVRGRESVSLKRGEDG